MAKSKEVVVKGNSVDALLSQAVANNVSVETMEKLFALREKVKAEQAKEAFTAAMADFQSDMPIIKKTKKVMNKDGRSVRYTFAPLDSIVDQIRKPLKTHGLSYRWETKNEEKNIKAICTVTHGMGHSESSEFEVPIDTEGYMTAPQKYASALTFAKRYSLCNVLGISTGDEDTDATDVNKEKESLSAKSKILFLLRTLKEKTGTKEDVGAAVKKLTSLELSETNYDGIVERLETIIAENNEN